VLSDPAVLTEVVIIKVMALLQGPFSFRRQTHVCKFAPSSIVSLPACAASFRQIPLVTDQDQLPRVELIVRVPPLLI